MSNDTDVLLYQSEDGKIRFDVKIKEQTVWLTQKQLAELFGCSTMNISLHIAKIFKTAELSEYSVIKYYFITADDGKEYNVKHYNLDAIISVGYRVNSQRGTDFRIWATQRLRELIVNGFSADNQPL